MGVEVGGGGKHGHLAQVDPVATRPEVRRDRRMNRPGRSRSRRSERFHRATPPRPTTTRPLDAGRRSLRPERAAIGGRRTREIKPRAARDAKALRRPPARPSSTMARGRRWTYARSGVDRGSVSESLRALLAGTHYRPPATSGRLLDLPGHYAASFGSGRETLAITTDTVGTKVRLAEEFGDWEGVGEDIVQVNVNDLAAVGARPSVLVDCVLCERPTRRPSRPSAAVSAADSGPAGSRSPAAKPPSFPEIVQGIDLGGTAVGFFPRGRRPVTGASGPARATSFLVSRPPGSTRTGSRSSAGSCENARSTRHRPRARGPAPPGGGAAPSLVESTSRPRKRSPRPPDDPRARAHLRRRSAQPRPASTTTSGSSSTAGRPRPVYRWAAELGEIDPRGDVSDVQSGHRLRDRHRPGAVDAPAGRSSRARVRVAQMLGRVVRGSGVSLPHLGLEYRGYS